MQTTAIGTVAKSLPQNVVILLTLLIPKRYIPYTDLRKICGISAEFRQINENVDDAGLDKMNGYSIKKIRDYLVKIRDSLFGERKTGLKPATLSLEG